MKVLFINSVCGVGSTGRICTDLAQSFIANGDKAIIAYGRGGPVPERFQNISVRIGSQADCAAHMLQTRLWDKHGFGSKRATQNFLKWAEEYQPDLVWLHNIHGYYIHVELLFHWIKQHPNMQVRWTLHDCWSFTGHCSHFVSADCQQWKTRCVSCPLLREYPACYGKGAVKENYERKRRAFTGVKNMTLITPCQWLADLTRQSFLKDYPVEVCYNTIDTDIFKPTPSDFREKHGLQEKFIVLGVSYIWDRTKGLDDFIKLVGMLDERYAVVLVGLTDKQIQVLSKKNQGYANRCEADGMAYDAGREAVPKISHSQVVPQDVTAVYEALTGHPWGGAPSTSAKLVCLPRTNGPRELAAAYTAADVFVNLTYEDSYPTVNLEAQACGTRVITYDTGGCRETLGQGGWE